MSEKLKHIPHINSYDEIRAEMQNDLQYRLRSRQDTTWLGRPLYLRINIQLIVTQECPYNCPFCLERKHPMKGNNDFEAQKRSLKTLLATHPDARLTITGGEPSLYPKHIKALTEIYSDYSNGTFCSINTAGFDTAINGLAHINLSHNDYVHNNPAEFPHCTVQTMLHDGDSLVDIKRKMDSIDAEAFSFRFESDLEKKDYPVEIWNELEADPQIEIGTFRIGDFFVYATFNYNGKHARVTLGDMWQQTHNDYKDGYSNIIIHPDGRIATNWK